MPGIRNGTEELCGKSCWVQLRLLFVAVQRQAQWKHFTGQVRKGKKQTFCAESLKASGI
jgi:hypothetical protein